MGTIKHVLLVDDDQTAIFVHRRLLQRLGAAEQISVARNGKEALRVILEEGPDLILLDVKMPVMDGLELLRELQGHTPVRPPVIYMLSTSTLPHEVEMARSFRVAGFIEKPLTSTQVERIARDHFSTD